MERFETKVFSLSQVENEKELDRWLNEGLSDNRTKSIVGYVVLDTRLIVTVRIVEEEVSDEAAVFFPG